MKEVIKSLLQHEIARKVEEFREMKLYTSVASEKFFAFPPDCGSNFDPQFVTSYYFEGLLEALVQETLNITENFTKSSSDVDCDRTLKTILTRKSLGFTRRRTLGASGLYSVQSSSTRGWQGFPWQSDRKLHKL
jgi:hypothetical protein